jgi:hypothetical protein
MNTKTTKETTKQEEYEKQLLKSIFDKINVFYIIYADTQEKYEEMAKTYKSIIQTIKNRAQKLDYNLR